MAHTSTASVHLHVQHKQLPRLPDACQVPPAGQHDMSAAHPQASLLSPTGSPRAHCQTDLQATQIIVTILITGTADVNLRLGRPSHVHSCTTRPADGAPLQTVRPRTLAERPAKCTLPAMCSTSSTGARQTAFKRPMQPNSSMTAMLLSSCSIFLMAICSIKGHRLAHYMFIYKGDAHEESAPEAHSVTSIAEAGHQHKHVTPNTALLAAVCPSRIAKSHQSSAWYSTAPAYTLTAQISGP